MSISKVRKDRLMAVEITLSAPTPGMSGKQLEQWNQRMFDAVKTLVSQQGEVVIISDHNDLDNNGGANSHASIASHISSERAHGTSSSVVGKDDAQELTSKTIDSQKNTIINLKHGVEVDNTTSAHGVATVAGLVEQQRFENKTEKEPFLTVFGNYAVKVTDKVIKVKGPAIITLPSAVGIAAQVFRIDNSFSLGITVRPAAGQKISDENLQIIPPGCTMVVYSDSTGWRIT